MPTTYAPERPAWTPPTDANHGAHGSWGVTSWKQYLRNRILVGSPHPDLFGQSIRTAILELPLPDGDMPDTFFRELVHDPSSRGPGRWVAMSGQGDARPRITYRVDVPADLPEAHFESGMEEIAREVADFCGRMQAKFPPANPLSFQN